MRVRLSRGFVLDGVTYPAQLAGVEIPNKVSRMDKKGKSSLWPIVAFEGWKDGDEAVPLPGDALILDETDIAEAEAVQAQEEYARRQEPVALSQLAKANADGNITGKK